MWALLIFCLTAFRLICFFCHHLLSDRRCLTVVDLSIFVSSKNYIMLPTYVSYQNIFTNFEMSLTVKKKSVLHKIVLILRNEMRYSRQKYSALDLWLRNFRHKKSPKNARKCSFFDWNTMSWILGQKQSRQMLAKPSSFFAPNTHIFKRLLQKRVNPKSIK